MEFDLTRLAEMHPLLAKSTALEYAHRAAVGLGRHGHSPGVCLSHSLRYQSSKNTLHWAPVAPEAGAQLDFQRVTEDAAEAVALAFSYVAKGWVVRRRLQRREFADWLLIDRNKTLVALEVSGVDMIDTASRRLKEKVEQVRKCKTPGTKAAFVVELKPPRSQMRIL